MRRTLKLTVLYRYCYPHVGYEENDDFSQSAVTASDRGSLQHYRALKGDKADFHCDAINKSLHPAAVHWKTSTVKRAIPLQTGEGELLLVSPFLRFCCVASFIRQSSKILKIESNACFIQTSVWENHFWFFSKDNRLVIKLSSSHYILMSLETV